ncbi:hypothetical protein G4B88_025365 [Cannabis sativa]|uniref:Cupin type-1 domain-containing protein n=1 Tax=Cannabis sativa TaxID=3483 RepID=A0A7J6HSX9_CANSA|nr:hypothetical protein G4B88_025365 [Cannabis sativa]
MGSRVLLLLVALFAIVSSIALASDPSSLQDFCVAASNSPVLVNGIVCKDPKMVGAQDFFFSGLQKPGNTSNALGSSVTPVGVTQIPGLNTLGISLARIDYAPWGINPPHTHPRASEILTVIEGSLEVGFVTSNPDNRLITKILHKGDVFVFPVGLIHYQKNVAHGNTIAIAALSSQNAGVITIANAVFGSKPDIPIDILARAFQLDKTVVANLQSKLISALMGCRVLLLLVALFAIVSSIALASDPSSLQDFCVAASNSPVLVNGFVCKDPKMVGVQDFFFSGLQKLGNTSNALGSRVTPVGVTQIPGLNTLGISLARIDYAPRGINPPHTHPRASEILTVIEGSLEVGFVTSNPDNRLITKILHKGDVFVFPVGLIHYQRNVAYGNTIAIAALSSQNAGVITIANAVFGSKPDIPVDILAKAFQLDKTVVGNLLSKF